ncbi:MAG: nicotinate phosphoribosyltransferase [Candidatus Competibacteraceae bacterium]
MNRDNRLNSVLLTDLYQLTMLQAYHRQRMEETAVFEMFVRRLPPNRGFLLAAGLAQALDYLETLHFTGEELEWLAGCGFFQQNFIDYLAQLRFTGDVQALPEGSVFFPNEPFLRVIAPLPEAQLVESRLINLLHYQTLIASKAARCVLAMPDRLLVDFGLRRAHGAEAGLMAARATYLAGFTGTATVLAGFRFAIPIFGTMAHSLVMAHDSEEAAFEDFALSQPDNVILLIDTYDTEEAARKLPHLAQRLSAHGIRIKGVRLDSGDLADHARQVRRILDDGGLRDVTIFASSDLDEYHLKELRQNAAPIDGFGIGNRLDISTDAPTLDCVYKLQEYAGKPRRKKAQGKATWPGRKQVYRRFNDNGTMVEDCLGLEEHPQPGEALLIPVMRGGQRLEPAESLATVRDRVKRQLAALPEALQANETTPPYPIRIAPELQALADRLDRETH